MGLTQRQAGTLIGGWPNAFQKYEAGDVTVSKGISNFLRMLERHPEEIEELKMGLTQRQAGALIGGGPNAFQKYEVGDVTVSKGISNFLRMPERHPEEIEELKKQA
jgi:HTH-type transcriptional regulator / antitoxin MqsA